jgi:4-amino-4-deoxy-L-arabinose transferase-like glycosyltransferase
LTKKFTNWWYPLDKLNNKQSINFLKKHLKTIFLLVILTVIVSVITYYRILVQIEMGPVSDSVVFLANALTFAGQGTGYSNQLFPPFFSFIVSLFFRMGYVFSSTLFYVDGGLFIFGVIGLFLLLKTRFNELESFLGALIYVTFPIVLVILGLGLSDLASVSISIWAVYLMVLAVKKDSRFFYLAFPFTVLAFLTRYNNALLIFPILLYLIINRDKINLKNFIIGIIVSILTIIPVFIYFFQQFGNIIYPFLNFATTSTIVTVANKNPYYDPNIFFFLEKLPSLIGSTGIIILIIIVLGIIIYTVLKLIHKIQDKKTLMFNLNLKNRETNIKALILIILALVFLSSFDKTIYMVSELLFFFIVYLFYELTKNLKIKYMKLNLMFLTWFVVFFIFHSIFVIKDVRYFVVMAPPLVYFMILGLSIISMRIKFNIKNRNIIFPLIAIILTSLMLLSTASQIPVILQKNQDNVIFNEKIQSASQWFVNYDPNYKSQNIYSDLWPNFSWYLKTNVKPVPVFHDNQTFLVGVVDFNFTQADSNAYNQYLMSNNAEYYFSVRNGLNLSSYYPIKVFGDLIIYKKKT